MDWVKSSGTKVCVSACRSVTGGAWKGYQFEFISYKFLAYVVKTMFIGEYCERLY